MPILWENQPGYRGIATISNENAGQVNVYSPVPAKYRRQTSMVLRPRIPLKQLNNVASIAKSQLSKKFKALTDENNKGIGSSAIKRKMKTSITKVAQKMNAKQPKLKSTNKNVSPTLGYRENVNKSPLTPFNPFNEGCSSAIRRSKRLSGFGSLETPCSKLKLRHPFTRKRKFQPDEFNSHLEQLSSGIETLKTNSSKLVQASNNMSPSPAKLIKLHETTDLNRSSKSSLNATKYKLMMEGTLNNENSIKQEKNPGKLRRTMTRASMRRRTLTSRFAHSASAIEDKFQGRTTYVEMDKKQQNSTRNFNIN